MTEPSFQVIELYNEHCRSMENVFRALPPFHGRYKRPTEQTIKTKLTLFKAIFTLLDIKPSKRMRRVQTEKILLP